MAFAGMFALGVFVGGVVTLGLKFTSSYDAFIKVMGAVLAATLSGIAVGFMDKYKGSAQPESFFMYPIGLLIALLWLYFPDVENQTNPLVKWGGMVSIVIVTIIASSWHSGLRAASGCDLLSNSHSSRCTRGDVLQRLVRSSKLNSE